MMNKRKNSSRSAGSGNNTTNRSSPRSRGPIAEGVYNNSHFLHAAASQVGNNVRVKTKGGVVVEGIFRTFSENFHIALEVPHRYQNGGDEKKINVDTVQDNLIIKLCDIVTIEAKDVDLEYATRDTFQTDTAIASRLNGPFRHGEKELEPWMDGPDTSGINGEMSVNLELDTKVNGWDANEMFSLNEKEHGIKTTYKDNLESYTVQIEKKDTMDFRKQELEAERIANEIENNPTTKERLDLENGDEETVFAAVARPEDQNSNMINNSNSTNNSSEKMTPPPSSQNKYIPKQQRSQTKMMPGTKMYSKPMQSVQTVPQQQQQQPVQQTVINGGAGFKTITINPPHQFNQPPPSHYVTQQQQQQQQQQNQQSQQIQHNQQVLNNPEVNKMNNDGREMGRENSNNNNNSNKSMPPPRNMRIMNPPPQIPTSFSEPPPQLNQVQQQQVSNQHMGKPINMHIPPPHLQAVQTVAQDGPQPTTVHVLPQPVVVVAHPSQIPIHPAAPQQQRPQRDPIMRSRNDDIRSLRQFHNDFQMAPPSAPQVPPQQSSQGIQTMPPQQRPEMQDNGQMVHIPQQNSSGPTSVDNSQQPPPHMKSHVNNNNNNNNANINHHITHHPTPSSTPHQEKSHGPSTPPQANTPQQQNVNSSNSVISNNTSSSSGINSTLSDVSSGNDKASLGTKKFTLNPQAKPFTPRNPSTPNQSSRPHTPQTPGPMAQAPQQPIPPPQQQVVYAPSGPLLYLVPSQQRPTAQATLARKTQFHQFQVTQATGQPIFNPPAPPQAVMPYHQMQTVQSQTYPQAIRMYPHEISAQQQPHLTSYLVPTPPSTTPSPGQPHQQTFHPGPQPSAGPPTQTFQPPGSYVMLMPSNAPPFVYNQHNPQSFQIVSSAMPQQQHPAQ